SLAVHLLSDLAPTFPHRLWFVALAPIADPALVPDAVASTIGLSQEAGSPPLAPLPAFLPRQPPLVLLDNCPHLIDACAALADHLLRTCPTLRILATSRELLQITGERQYRLAPLAVPTLDRLADRDALA